MSGKEKTIDSVIDRINDAKISRRKWGQLIAGAAAALMGERFVSNRVLYLSPRFAD